MKTKLRVLVLLCFLWLCWFEPEKPEVGTERASTQEALGNLCALVLEMLMRMPPLCSAVKF